MFKVALDRAPKRAASIEYGVADGTATAGADHRAATGTLEFAPGEDSKTVAVTVLGDADVEGDETVLLRLRPLYRDGRPAGIHTLTGTIKDDDEPTLSIDSRR